MSRKAQKFLTSEYNNEITNNNELYKELMLPLSTFVENNIMPLAVLDRNFNFLLVNKAYADADNREPSDFIGHNHFDFYPSRENEEIFKKVVETKKAYQAFAKPFTYKSNPERGISYWDWQLSPVLDDSGEVFLLILSLIDVTDSIKTLMEIDYFFNISTDILCIINFKGNFVRTNPAFKKILGYTQKDIYSMKVFDLIYEEDKEKTIEIIETSIKRGTPFLFENRCLHKNGNYRWLEWNVRPDFRRKLIYASIRDITERKESQKRIEFLASVVNSTNDAILTGDLEGNILSWNEGAEKIYGYTADEIIGKNITTFAPTNLEYIPEKDILEEVRKGERISNFETIRRRKDGELIYLSKTISPIYDKNNIMGFSIIAKDISEQKKYEKEILKLDRLNLLGELAASISHEVRNPITTIKGFLQLLKEKERYKENRKYFDLMIEELDRANKIISEFLSIGKYKPVQLKKQNLNLILKKITPLLQADALSKNSYIKLELDDIPDLFLNEEQIRQVILNLVRNGLEAMKTGGKIIIKTFKSKEGVVLVVQDEGCGIDPKVLKNLGKPFITTKKDGTGLGLATCYTICKEHGATIDVKTSPKGTIFYIKFRKNVCQR